MQIHPKLKLRQCWVQLGRLGDIINILPLLYQQNLQTGKKPHLMVAQPYLPLLEGVTYVEPCAFYGDFADLKGALAHAKQRYQDLQVTQVYAHGMSFPHHTGSFLEESWNRVGRVGDWGKLPLIFDRRDTNRERNLVMRFDSDRPLILVAASGLSSPFPHKAELLATLTEAFSDTHEVIDLSRLQASRFYDLLGLFDKAHCLVTIDTGHMHLAKASRIPTVALITDGPTPWHRSAPIAGQILRMLYSEFPSRKADIIDAISKLPLPRTKHLAAVTGNRITIPRKLIHVYSDYQRSGDSAHRHLFAKGTWLEEYHRQIWSACPIENSELKRTSQTEFQDTRQMPFIKDLVMRAVEKADVRQNDIIVIANDDICFASGLGKWLLEASDYRAIWAHRWDFQRLSHPLTPAQIRTGMWCVGSDLFAFTLGWWLRHSASFPDMVLGCECWDWVLRELMRDTGGFEVHCMIYHQFHWSYWVQGNNRYANPGNVWNQRLARRWLIDRQKPLKELTKVQTEIV